jgi:hypothetical protein
VREQEGPESVKRELTRAQEELKKICDRQLELAGLLEREDADGDPNRAHALRNGIDQYAVEHYRSEVRVKALEIKMLELLLGNVKTGDAELRERSESTLKRKWEDLRALCETPAKIVYESDQWVTVPTGPTASISDLRMWLREFDVVLPERGVGEPEPAEALADPAADPAEPGAPAAFELPEPAEAPEPPDAAGPADEPAAPEAAAAESPEEPDTPPKPDEPASA